MKNGSTAVDIRQVWSDSCAILASQMSEDAYQQWITLLVPRHVTDKTISLAVEDPFTREWIMDKLARDIASAVAKVLGRKVAIEILVSGQLLLPSVAPKQAIIPNALARSGLFGVQERGSTPYLERVEVESWKNTRIRYTGPQLDQHDLDVWLQCIRLMRDEELGQPVEFTAHGFLKELGKGRGGKVSKRDYDFLDRRLTRLVATAVDVQIADQSYVSSLLLQYYREDNSGRFVVVADPLMAALFKNGEFGRIDWEQRKLLRGQLSKFLHAYLTTHSTKNGPHFISVQKLKNLSRSSTKHLWKFRQMLQKAANELVTVGALQEWWIDDNDIAHFVRPTTKQSLETTS